MNTLPKHKRKRLASQQQNDAGSPTGSVASQNNAAGGGVSDAGAPNPKKRKVSEFESALENHDVRILKKQKQMIQKKFKEKMRENKKLTKQLSSIEKDRDAHMEILSYIDQLWNDLSNDANHLVQRLAQMHSSSQTPQEDSSLFLSQLLNSYKTFSEYSINNQKARSILSDKLSLTKKLLTNFVNAVDLCLKTHSSGSQSIDSDSLQKSINASQLKLKKIQSEYAQSEAKIAILEKKGAESKEQIVEIQEELKEAHQKIQKLEEQLQESHTQIERAKREAAQSALSEAATTSDIPATDEQTQRIIQGLRVDVHHFKSIIKLKEEELLHKSQECINLKAQHEKALKEAQSQEALEKTLPYQQLLEKVASLNNKLTLYQQEIESAQEKENLANAKLATLRTEILAETQKKLDSIKSRVIERDTTIRNLRHELESNKEIAEKAKESTEYEKQINMLKAKLESKTKKLTRLRADILECFSKDQNELVSKIKFLQKQKKIADKKVTEMEGEVQNLRKRIEEAGKDPDTASLQELQQKVDELTKFKESVSNTDQQKKIDELTSELEEQKILCNDFEQELNDLSHHCEELNVFKDRQAEQIRRLEAQDAESTLERSRERKRLRIYLQEREKLLEKVELQKQLNEKLQNQLQTLQQSKTAQDQSMALLQKKYQLEQKTVETQRHQQTEIRNNITAERRQREAIEVELAGKRDELLLIQKNYADLDDQFKHLEDDSERLKVRLQKAMTGSSDELREELDEYKKKVICNICQTNDKSVLITRCHHTFCRPCIDRQVSSRSRRCPTCGASYSPHGDLMDFYL